MSDIPTKMYWRGEDIETMSREQLLEVIRGLADELKAARATTRTIIDMQQKFEEVRRRFR